MQGGPLRFRDSRRGIGAVREALSIHVFRHPGPRSSHLTERWQIVRCRRSRSRDKETPQGRGSPKGHGGINGGRLAPLTVGKWMLNRRQHGRGPYRHSLVVAAEDSHPQPLSSGQPRGWGSNDRAVLGGRVVPRRRSDLALHIRNSLGVAETSGSPPAQWVGGNHDVLDCVCRMFLRLDRPSYRLRKYGRLSTHRSWVGLGVPYRRIWMMPSYFFTASVARPNIPNEEIHNKVQVVPQPSPSPPVPVPLRLLESRLSSPLAYGVRVAQAGEFSNPCYAWIVEDGFGRVLDFLGCHRSG